MTNQDGATRPLPKKKLLLATGGALIAGALIVVGVVMPAEYDVDLLGVGKLSGLSRLWAPGENEIDPNAGSVQRAREFPTPWRTDVVEIPLTAMDLGVQGAQLEYKFHLPKDGTLIYSWEVIGADDPKAFEFDFHGHTVPKLAKEEMVVATYKKGHALSGNGALIAPFEGIHGWFLSNDTGKPVVVRIKAAGFYELIKSGAPGNEGRIIANVPAEAARPNIPKADPAPP